VRKTAASGVGVCAERRRRSFVGPEADAPKAFRYTAP
jgi:hypothetical protein